MFIVKAGWVRSVPAQEIAEVSKVIAPIPWVKGMLTKQSQKDAVDGAVGVAPIARVQKTQTSQGIGQGLSIHSQGVSCLALPVVLPLPRPFVGRWPSCACRSVASVLWFWLWIFRLVPSVDHAELLQSETRS